jgi:hypothetical protein
LASFKKLKSGLWQAQVRVKHVRTSGSFATKTKAKDWAAVQEYRIKTEAAPTFVKKYSVSELFLRYEGITQRKSI